MKTSTATPTFTATSVMIQTFTPTNTVSAIITATVPSVGDAIFGDDFESGDLSTWSGSVTNSGNLSVQTSAALVGNMGLRVNIINNTSMYMTDNSPTAEKHYRVRFYFDPNSITMASGDAHNIFYAYSGNATTALIRSAFFYTSSQYRLNMQVRNDADAWLTTSTITLSDAPHVIEFEWQAASAPSGNDGKFLLWQDGSLVSSITGLDNDARGIDVVRFGPSAGIDTGTRGIYYLDAFEIPPLLYIGPAIP